MSGFDALIKFRAKDDNEVYFAAITSFDDRLSIPLVGSVATGYKTIAQMQAGEGSKNLTIDSLLAPVPSSTAPIYCVGLNYRSHAQEAKLEESHYPPLWTKPVAALADPGEAIPVNEFCATSLLDYEGELVFVTSKDAKNITKDEAPEYILGYTIGNDLSCRKFQLVKNSGGQFFFAKAFDRFAPIGPALVSRERFEATSKGRRLVTRVNGKVVQDVEISKDVIFTPAQILSHMSQGTTIPAGTAVMTGTPAGVGAFRSPMTFLNDGDRVEVEVDHIGVLSNVIRFDK